MFWSFSVCSVQISFINVPCENNSTDCQSLKWVGFDCLKLVQLFLVTVQTHRLIWNQLSVRCQLILKRFTVNVAIWFPEYSIVCHLVTVDGLLSRFASTRGCLICWYCWFKYPFESYVHWIASSQYHCIIIILHAQTGFPVNQPLVLKLKFPKWDSFKIVWLKKSIISLTNFSIISPVLSFVWIVAIHFNHLLERIDTKTILF